MYKIIKLKKINIYKIIKIHDIHRLLVKVLYWCIICTIRRETEVILHEKKINKKRKIKYCLIFSLFLKKLILNFIPGTNPVFNYILNLILGYYLYSYCFYYCNREYNKNRDV